MVIDFGCLQMLVFCVLLMRFGNSPSFATVKPVATGRPLFFGWFMVLRSGSGLASC